MGRGPQLPPPWTGGNTQRVGLSRAVRERAGIRSVEPCLVLIMLWFCGGAREPSGVAHLALPSSDWLCESHALGPRLAVRMGSQWWSWVTGGRGGGAGGQGSATPSADGRGEGAAQTRGAAPGHVPRGRGGATGERVLTGLPAPRS